MTLLFILLVPLFCSVTCKPAHHSSDGGTKVKQIGDLSTKLARLQTMLQDLQKDEETIFRAKEDESSEPDMTSEPVVTSLPDAVEHVTDDEHIVNMKKYVSSLTPRELETLQVLKKVLELRKQQREDNVKTTGTFSDKEIIDDKDEGVQTASTKIGSKQVPPKRVDLEKDDGVDEEAALVRVSDEGDDDEGGSDEGDNAIPVHTEEGDFGAFRDEIKHSVEKNLLTDIALAVHAGISVDEMLEDLVHKADHGDDGELAPPKSRHSRD